MTLGEILSGVALRQPLAPELAQTTIQGLEYDSRRVEPGWLFFAFSGSHADGRQFARDALARGAVAVVSESEAPEGLAARLAERWVHVAHPHPCNPGSLVSTLTTTNRI